MSPAAAPAKKAARKAAPRAPAGSPRKAPAKGPPAPAPAPAPRRAPSASPTSPPQPNAPAGWAPPAQPGAPRWAPPQWPAQPQPGRAPLPPSSPPPAPVPAAPTVRYVQRPFVWTPAEEPMVDRVSRTDLRLALALLGVGFVAVFLRQMPLGAQIVIGAPLFEEMFKLGLALLPCAALGFRLLALRLPFAFASGAGFGFLEHFLSYSDEPDFVLYGRVAFHALSAGLSMLVLHGLTSAGPRRLVLACTFPSTLVHAANNTVAVELGLLSALTAFDPDGTIGLGFAALFLTILLVAFVSWPTWQPGYHRMLLRYVLPRLGPPAAPGRR